MKAGDYVAWEWAAGRTLVVRGADAAIAAYVNTCRHRPHVLVAGEAGHLDGDIVCPADGAVHRLDGGELAVLPVVMNDFAVFVAREAAAGAAPRFSLAGVAPVGAWACTDVAANWRLVVEHWADSYLDESARTFGAGGAGVVQDTGGASVSKRFEVGDESGWISQRLYAQLNPASGQAVERMLIWPNLFVERRADGTTIRQCLPLAPGRSRIRVRRYRAAKADRALRAMFYLAMRMERVWQREDVRLIESMQGGEEGSAATAGAALRAFWAWMDGAG